MNLLLTFILQSEAKRFLDTRSQMCQYLSIGGDERGFILRQESDGPGLSWPVVRITIKQRARRPFTYLQYCIKQKYFCLQVLTSWKYIQWDIIANGSINKWRFNMGFYNTKWHNCNTMYRSYICFTFLHKLRCLIWYIFRFNDL